MDPSAANPDTIYQILLVILALANGLGALGTFIQAVKGRPAIKRDEYDKDRAYVDARLDGLNEKINKSLAKLEDKQDKILEELREVIAATAKHEGRLEERRA